MGFSSREEEKRLRNAYEESNASPSPYSVVVIAAYTVYYINIDMQCVSAETVLSFSKRGGVSPHTHCARFTAAPRIDRLPKK